MENKSMFYSTINLIHNESLQNRFPDICTQEIYGVRDGDDWQRIHNDYRNESTEVPVFGINIYLFPNEPGTIISYIFSVPLFQRH